MWAMFSFAASIGPVPMSTSEATTIAPSMSRQLRMLPAVRLKRTRVRSESRSTNATAVSTSARRLICIASAKPSGTPVTGSIEASPPFIPRSAAATPSPSAAATKGCHSARTGLTARRPNWSASRNAPSPTHTTTPRLTSASVTADGGSPTAVIPAW